MGQKPATSIWKLALYLPTVILLAALLVISRHLGSYILLDIVVIFVLPGFISLYLLNLGALWAIKFFGVDGTKHIQLIAIALLLFLSSWFLSTNVLCPKSICTISSGLPLTVYEINADKYQFFELMYDKRYLFDSMLSSYLDWIIRHKEYDINRESPLHTVNLMINFLLHLLVVYIAHLLIYKVGLKKRPAGRFTDS